MAERGDQVRSSRRARIEAAIFTTFALLHTPGAAVALTQPTLDPPPFLPALLASGSAAQVAAVAVVATASVLASLALWTALTVMALLSARRGHLVSRTLLTAAFAVDAVVLTISGLSPPRLGNITAASVGLVAICAAAALLTRPRLLPGVLVPAVAGQAVLLSAADAGATTARLVADVATVTAASAATAALIAWLQHERRTAQAALARAALTDPLTGLLNRRGLERGLPALLGFGAGARDGRGHRRRLEDRAAAVATTEGMTGGPAGGSAGVWVVVIDIDHFKAVNDRLGHDGGDQVLVEVARALQDCSRRGDLLVRWGGEELAWVARWRTTVDAVAAVERLRALVSGRTRDAGQQVTISAGVAEALSAVQVVSGPDVGQLGAGEVLRAALVRADGALYRAKAAGRDRVEVAAGGGSRGEALVSE